MPFSVTAIEWISILFFFVVSVLLYINILTINKLKEDKTASSDNEELLTKLLGQIQSYFSKIDSNMNTVVSKEKEFHQLFDAHQQDESTILKALEVNQTLFLDRMDKIVNIQQGLSDRLKQLESQEGNISPEMIRMASSFMGSQKRDLNLMKSRIENLVAIVSPLQILQEEMQLKTYNNPDIQAEMTSNKHILDIKNTLFSLTELLQEEHNTFDGSKEDIASAQQNIEALVQHIDIAKRNIQSVIEQSIDLNPVYKSIHELVEQIKNIFDDYHLAKGEIQSLLTTLKEHENKDLVDLKKEVSIFLLEIKQEIKTSVAMLKKEYHLGQNQVTDTVKILSDKSQASSAYASEMKES